MKSSESASSTLKKEQQFIWHCLAKGTLVTMADGTTLPIEQLNNTDTVLTSGGVTLPVRATSQAPASRDEVLTIEGASGHFLTLSDGCIVWTSAGPLQAGELKIGDKIITLDGKDTISSIERRAYNGQLYNLHLGNGEQPGAMSVSGTNFFANGILVGDHQVQTAYLNNALTDKEYVLSKLPQE